MTRNNSTVLVTLTLTRIEQILDDSDLTKRIRTHHCPMRLGNLIQSISKLFSLFTGV